MSLSSKIGANKSCISASNAATSTASAFNVVTPLSKRDKASSALKLFNKPSTSSNAPASAASPVSANTPSNRARSRVRGARKSCARLSLTCRVAPISVSSCASMAFICAANACHSAPSRRRFKRVDKSPSMTGFRAAPIASTCFSPRRARNAPPPKPTSSMAMSANTKAWRKAASKFSPSAISCPTSSTKLLSNCNSRARTGAPPSVKLSQPSASVVLTFGNSFRLPAMKLPKPSDRRK